MDLTNKRFGRLFVQKRLPNYRTPKGKGHAQYECLCDCGVIKSVLAQSLIKGRTKSCGCLYNESIKTSSQTHGQGAQGRRTGAYTSWAQMKSRCSNPKVPEYIWYGKRGIKVCERWMSFEKFYEDMGDRPEGCSIDRIDVDKGYSPENCRWATVDQQQNNTTRSHFIEAGGQRLTIGQWCKKTGLSKSCIQGRLRRGWSPQRAVGYE